jgi:hypothetical protein
VVQERITHPWNHIPVHHSPMIIVRAEACSGGQAQRPMTPAEEDDRSDITEYSGV